MLAKTSRYILILTILTVLTVAAITAVANAQTTQPARMFNSTLRLNVYAEIERDGFIEYELLGQTPSDKPIAIPHEAKWSVSPNNAGIKDAGLRVIRKEILDQDIPGLKLSGCNNITDAGLAHLKGLTKLKRLDLPLGRVFNGGGNKTTDAGLAHLKGLTKLELLKLSSCVNITAAGAAHLKGLAKLKNLHLGGCDKITDADIAELKKALPNTTITH
jgi:hypothetical protein